MGDQHRKSTNTRKGQTAWCTIDKEREGKVGPCEGEAWRLVVVLTSATQTQFRQLHLFQSTRAPHRIVVTAFNQTGYVLASIVLLVHRYMVANKPSNAEIGS